MRRSTILIVLAAAAFAAPACQTRTTSTTSWADVADGALMKRALRSYHAVRSQYQGHVGYMKVYDIREAGGPIYTWKYVYDLDHNELGFVDQYGKAYRYPVLPNADQQAQNEPLRVDHMPSDSLERNVMRMLGLDPALDDVSFPTMASST